MAFDHTVKTCSCAATLDESVAKNVERVALDAGDTGDGVGKVGAGRGGGICVALIFTYGLTTIACTTNTVARQRILGDGGELGRKNTLHRGQSEDELHKKQHNGYRKEIFNS